MNSRKRILQESSSPESAKRSCYSPSTYSSDSDSQGSPSGLSQHVSGFFRNTFIGGLYRRFSDMCSKSSWFNKVSNGESANETSNEEVDENMTPRSLSFQNLRDGNREHLQPSSYSCQVQRPRMKHLPFSLSTNNPFLKRTTLLAPRDSQSPLMSKKKEFTDVFLPVPVVKSKKKAASKRIFKDNGSTLKASSRYHGSLPCEKSSSYFSNYANTARESIRLDERERYLQLLQKYTDIPLAGSVKSSEVSSRRGSSSSTGDIRNNESKNVSSKSSGSQSPVIKTVLNPDNSDKLRRKLLSLSKSSSHVRSPGWSSSESRLDKTPIIVDVEGNSGSSRTQSDDEVEIIGSKQSEKKSPFTPPIVISTKAKLKAKKRDCEFFSSKWTNDLMKELDRNSSKLKSLIEISASKMAEYERARENRSELFRKKLRQRYENGLRVSFSEFEEKDSKPEKAFVELTDEMEAQIDDALIPTPAAEVLVEGFNLTIRRRDVETLSKLNWLNDEIINFYLNLVVDRGKTDDHPSVYSFNTFFYPKLINGGHGALKRWTRKTDIFSYQFIVIPVHLGMHWCLAVIDFINKEICYYDSLLNDNSDCLNALKTYLCDESLDKKKEEFDTSDWSLKTPKDIPQQMNGSDCGMFACIYAEYITREAKITFVQEDMPYFRRRMVYEILTKTLL